MNINDERQFIIEAVTQARIPTVHPDAANTVDIGRAVLAAYRALLAAAPSPAAVDGAKEEDFVAWLAREMPAGTVIADPAWWAHRILRAVGAAPSEQQAAPEQEGGAQ